MDVPHDDLSAEGPSFPLFTKVLAGAMIGALLVWALRALDDLYAAAPPASAWLLLGAALVVVLVCYGGMLRGRTAVTPTHLRQRWLWTKEVALADVRQARLIDLPGLRWLIAPRLMLRLRGGGFCTIHAADSAVLASMRRLGLGEHRVF
jgi:hypothetical protein